MRLPTVRLSGVKLNAITERQCIDHILDELDAGRGGTVVTPNLDHLRRATRDITFGALVAEADLVVPDGMPLVWASRLQGTPLPQRVAGSDLISSLCAAAATRGRSVFLLGGAPGTAEGAARVLQQASPDLRVVGTHCPPMGFEKDEDRMNEVVAALMAAQPDIVFVALGSPKQEYLIERIRKILPNAWWLGVGVSFSFLCGDVKRAPMWMRRIGMEWVHRLFQEPRRLFRRYVVVGIPFGTRLLSDAFVSGLPRRLGRELKVAPAPAVYPVDGNGNGNGNGHHGGNGSAYGDNGNGKGHTVEAVRSVIATSFRVDGALMGPPPPPAADAAPDGEPQVAAPMVVMSTAATPATRSLQKLRALVLLGGSIRPTPLSASIGRSVLDLPLDDAGSVLNHWLSHAADLARYAGLERLPVRVMVNRASAEPGSVAPRFAGSYRVERDLSEYRGTGGVLRDLAVAAEYDDDDLILVANAQQVLIDPLVAIAAALNKKQADVGLVSHDDGTPSGVYLVRCRALRLIPTVGYVDMKEQALPAIAGQHAVAVVHRRRPTGLPVRSLADYLQALRHYHRRRLGHARPTLSDPLAEDWLPAFAIVEDASTVDPRSHVHDSVVLRGGVVEPGAIVVRSLVCPGGVVRRDRSAVDQFVRRED
jgi:N-acetylglucosaminyldiphosphoundecaprenol N-acetyl-beta-D-mannosaminyltransferase